jgi:RNA polymerase sigma-70 factor (ECF subfamily)
LERVRSRDRQAWQVLMQRYNQRLFRITRSVLTSAEAAAERVQEAYLHASDGLPAWSPDEKPGTWLAKIAYGQAVSMRRQGIRGTTPAKDMVGHERPLPPSLPEGDDPRALEKLIDELPEVFRPVFVLRVLEGLSGTDTARCLGIKATTVRTRLHRALRRLPAGMAKRVSTERGEIFELQPSVSERIIQVVLSKLDD